MLNSRLLCTAVLLLSSTALRADVFNFSFSGPGGSSLVDISGTITATATGGGNYNVTDLVGIWGTTAISDPSTNKGSFHYSGPSSNGSFSFLLSGVVNTVTFTGGNYFDTGFPYVGSDFAITRAPEAATISLLFAMGLGVWGMARKLRLKNSVH